MTTPRDVLTRLQSITWLDVDACFDHERSRAALMLEYLRRAGAWAQFCDAEQAWPFFDIGALIDPALQVEEDVAADLEAFVSKVFWDSHKKVCRGAVKWPEVVRRHGVDLPDLGDPYEPLLLMFERGGGFSMVNEFVDLTGAMIPVRNLHHHLSNPLLESTHTEALDALDALDAR
ncbi:hypothetical protein V1J52_22725 [Streptomyces sp. TRM 70351]|uniref:hypothetical protein n=1 Tax=Streptomyces sp. TRM 70351 TaxID=3116552 RepID=UPI002E7C389D|nr:hypothetical protein [Streptomyces sp. TRM 70351]MEE1930957.1 hypothetical protein [Streptomyces sp. TRM 70351]